ncbi:MAG: hypothetical protein ACI84D_003051, partial [Thalassolituus oleivorans]
NSYFRFYLSIARLGLDVEGRFCPFSESINEQPTRLGDAGVWIHFDRKEMWIHHITGADEPQQRGWA